MSVRSMLLKTANKRSEQQGLKMLVILLALMILKMCWFAMCVSLQLIKVNQRC